MIIGYLLQVNIYIFLGLLLFFFYIISLLFFIFGIFRISNKSKKTDIINNISIIVCVKNGEYSLPNILSDLHQQSYPGNLEFIIVDDESTDQTKNIIYQFSNVDTRFKYFNTNSSTSQLKHKKRALELGINQSKYNWLLYTDVDCRVKNTWALEMSKNFGTSDYVIGLSEVKEENSLVSKFQSIDFRMLMISACSSVFMNYPLACTGQNQSYKKDIFNSISGYTKISGLLQGDDSIFLQICRKYKKIKVSFSVNKESFVRAKTHNKWKDFIIQRIRWAGDANIMWKYNMYFYFIILSTFLSNLFIITLIFNNNYYLAILLLSVKFIFENFIYTYGSKKMKIQTNQISFILWFFIQIPYIVFMGVASFFVNNILWKGQRA